MSYEKRLIEIMSELEAHRTNKIKELIRNLVYLLKSYGYEVEEKNFSGENYERIFVFCLRNFFNYTTKINIEFVVEKNENLDLFN